MRNQQWPSLVVGVLLAAAIVIGPGIALAGFVSGSVNPLNQKLTVDEWRNDYIVSVAWSAVVAALFAAIWLLLAHGGRGHDTKSGSWFALWGVAIFGAALLAWFIPPAVREGPAVPMAVNAALVLVGYWVATLCLTPDHYRFTPLLGQVIWGRRA